MRMSRFPGPVKRRILAGALLTLSLVLSWSAFSKSRDKENVVFSKIQNLELLEAPNPEAKAVAKAKWNEELSILEEKGRWLKVSAASGDGWVYSGAVSSKELEGENKNDMSSGSGVTASAASRGLTGTAEEYADRHDVEEVAKQVTWAEKLSAGITKAQAKAYLKEHKLGEFAGAK